jgi:hypothetical protein
MTDDPATRRCPWCDATATPEATHCMACGAALAQRDDLGGLTIPGVTAVDPALLDADSRPLHIPGNSPSQGVAGGLALAALMGGPVGLAAIGGIGAVAAGEYLAASRGHATRPEDLAAVGRPSEIALRMAEQLDKGRPGGAAPGADAPGDPPVVDDSAGNSDNSTRD